MFKIHHRLIGSVEPLEHLAGAAGLVPGSAAKYTGGSLAKCGATEKPTHIVAGPDENGLYAAIPVLGSTVFETQSSETISANLIGSAVTLAEDADGVTATTASGVFTIDWADGAAGGVVHGHFA